MHRAVMYTAARARAQQNRPTNEHERKPDTRRD